MTQELNRYQEKLDTKCMSDPTPVVRASQMVPVFDFLIDSLVQNTPNVLNGKLPDGLPEILVKGKMKFEEMEDVDLCSDSGVDDVRQAVMPHIMSRGLKLKRSFNRYCPLYRGWLTTEEGKSFVKGLDGVVDQVLE